jgi:hypothetical protein
MGNKKFIIKCSVGKPEGTNHLEKVDKNGRLISIKIDILDCEDMETIELA